MSKGYLVFDDIPDSCLNCPVVMTDVNGCNSLICGKSKTVIGNPFERHENCPIKTLPDRDLSSYIIGYFDGWNAVLNKLEGEN